MSEIKVGDRVRIINEGACYTTYYGFIKKHEIRNYSPYCLHKGDIGMVVKLGKHEWMRDIVLAIQNEENGGVTLYSEYGVEKVMTLRDKVAEVMPNNINRAYCGGVQGCPHDSGYIFLNVEVDYKYCKEESCEECWSRPFIEKVEDQKEEEVVMQKAKEVKEDMVNNPSHYMNGKVACIDAIESATVNKTGIEAVCVANVIKYLWRYEDKNGLEDIEKMLWYGNKLKDVLVEREKINKEKR